MATLGLALWEAWSEPLELISMHAGSHADNPLALRPPQVRPGALWTDNVYPTDRQQFQRYLLAAEPTCRHRSIDYRMIVGDGELLWVRHWILDRVVDRYRGRERLRGLIMPIPEQKHLEWECLRVSEHERNRIGQELHDDLCQVLSGLSLMMRVLSQRASTIAPELGKEIDELNGHVLGATDRVRSMAHGLFPAQLNCTTVRHALKEFVRQTTARFPVKLTLELPRRKLPHHSPEQIIHVYRIAQEAVSNAVRHGQASAIKIVLHAAAEGMQMDVEDNGRGLPAFPARPEGIGMHVMQYRARMLGGTLQFRNVSPHGAAAHLVYPTLARPTPHRSNHKPVSPRENQNLNRR